MMRYQDIVTTNLQGDMLSFFVPHQFNGVLAVPSKAPALEASETQADERL
jgi:hypothetical protein